MPRTVPHLKYFQVLADQSYTVDATPGAGQPGAAAVWLGSQQVAAGAEVIQASIGAGSSLKGHVLTVNVKVVDANAGMPNVSALVTIHGSNLAPVQFGDVIPTSDGDEVIFVFEIHLV